MTNSQHRGCAGHPQCIEIVTALVAQQLRTLPSDVRASVGARALKLADDTNPEEKMGEVAAFSDAQGILDCPACQAEEQPPAPPLQSPWTPPELPLAVARARLHATEKAYTAACAAGRLSGWKLAALRVARVVYSIAARKDAEERERNRKASAV